MELKQEIEEKEKELNDLKYKLETEEKKNIIKEKALKYFDKNFGLSYIHDDYDVLPKETFCSIRSRFVNKFYDSDKSLNEHNLKELRKNYLKILKTDIDRLQEQYEMIQEEFKELKMGD